MWPKGPFHQQHDLMDKTHLKRTEINSGVALTLCDQDQKIFICSYSGMKMNLEDIWTMNE